MATSKQSVSPPAEATQAPAGIQLPPELLAGLQPGGGATGASTLIGNLPAGYGDVIKPSQSAISAELGGGPQGKALYHDGDQVALFQGLRTADIMKLQQRLMTAGYLDTEFRYGDIGDVGTQKALTELLASSNIAGEDYETTLSFAESTGMWYDPATGKFTKGKRPGGKLPTTLSDPNNLREVLQGVAGNQLGRRLSDQEVSQFVSKFHGIEQANDAGNLDAPNIELYADQFAQQADPTAYEGQSLVNVFSEAMKVIGGGIETKVAEPIQAGGINTEVK